MAINSVETKPLTLPPAEKIRRSESIPKSIKIADNPSIWSSGGIVSSALFRVEAGPDAEYPRVNVIARPDDEVADKTLFTAMGPFRFVGEPSREGKSTEWRTLDTLRFETIGEITELDLRTYAGYVAAQAFSTGEEN